VRAGKCVRPPPYPLPQSRTLTDPPLRRERAGLPTGFSSVREDVARSGFLFPVSAEHCLSHVALSGTGSMGESKPKVRVYRAAQVSGLSRRTRCSSRASRHSDGAFECATGARCDGRGAGRAGFAEGGSAEERKGWR
jgi:hypothetical protein